MTGSLKYNAIFLVLNGGLAYLISYLFADGVVAKTPFPITRTFKDVLQRGVIVKDLDPSYVSALSWYFLVLFCSGSYTHIINRVLGLMKLPSVSMMETLDPMMGAMMSSQEQPQFGPQDPAKTFQAEADAWKLTAQAPFMEGIEGTASKILAAS